MATRKRPRKIGRNGHVSPGGKPAWGKGSKKRAASNARRGKK